MTTKGSLALARLAAGHGIETDYVDAFGAPRTVPEDSLRALLTAMGVPCASERQIVDGLAETRGPATEPSPPATGGQRAFGFTELGHQRLWGIATQLYGLRSTEDWGIGDLGDLGDLAETAAGLGAAALGINPLHALFPADPGHFSPYSPSDRRFLNPLYIDVEAVEDLAESAEAGAMLASAEVQRQLHTLRASELVDYKGVQALKLGVLRHLHASFRARHLARDTDRARAFRAFVEEMGEPLRQLARFDTLHEDALAQGHGWGWRGWPAPRRDPASPEVEAFAAHHAERIEFFQYLQWLADQQLGRAHDRARAAGMAIGLYRDLAVAVHPDGARTWGEPEVVVVGASVGAPPDQFNPAGQNWGLAPFSPRALIERQHRPFAEDLALNMRHGGALRIDHAMGLARLFWIPDGASPAEGAYVRYPLDELLQVVARESRRQRCLVIGEDLGTVPPGFRRAMAAAGLLSYRVLYFERTRRGAFRAPRAYPREALATVSTHDLPTLAGFWTGRDLAWREALSADPDGSGHRAARRVRALDRRRLVAALARSGRLPAGIDPGTLPEDLSPELSLAIHRHLAETPCRLVMAQLEDALGEVEQANLPGTVAEHPNWRRRLPCTIEALAEAPGLRGLGAALAAAGRGHP